MTTILKLTVIAALPVAASVLLYLAERTEKGKTLPYAKKQLLYGLIFGISDCIFIFKNPKRTLGCKLNNCFFAINTLCTLYFY